MSRKVLVQLLVVAGIVVAGALGFGWWKTQQQDEAGKPAPEVSAQAPQKGESAVPAGTDAAASGAAARQSADAGEAASDAGAGEVDAAVPTFDLMRVERDGSAVVAGRSEPGAIIALLSNGKVVGRGIANATGEFAIVLDEPLAPGAHSVTLEVHNAEGETAAQSVQSLAVSVPQDPQSGEVLVMLNTPGTASQILQKPEALEAATESASGKAPADQVAAAAIDKPDASAPSEAAAPAESAAEDATSAPSAAPTVTVDAVETEDSKVYVAGAGEPNSDVRVYLDNKLVGEARTDSKGRWLLEADSAVAPGEVEVRADQVAPNTGAVTARAEVTFNRADEDDIVLRPVAASGSMGGGEGASGDAAKRQIANIIIRSGDNLWTISQRRYGEGLRYTTIYQANKDQIRNPDLIYPGQVFMMPEGDRNWPSQN
ncbi:Ig-like domain-containing protein [Stappia indica]|uniref:Ig-like domain-containing protein n=1 Tax=Stappia indica TaxID=538381 RepID=UPI001CD51B0E|nr:Ig-like domain-containing protein [Stappia indica]MCA1298702.1 Ig-like domain-containing protein [Stappia indica]